MKPAGQGSRKGRRIYGLKVDRVTGRLKDECYQQDDPVWLIEAEGLVGVRAVVTQVGRFFYTVEYRRSDIGGQQLGRKRVWRRTSYRDLIPRMDPPEEPDIAKPAESDNSCINCEPCPRAKIARSDPSFSDLCLEL